MVFEKLASKMFQTNADPQARVAVVEEPPSAERAHVKRLERECAAEAKYRH